MPTGEERVLTRSFSYVNERVRELGKEKELRKWVNSSLGLQWSNEIGGRL